MTASPVAIVTGATGFVGSRLAARLAEGDWTVYALVRGTDRALPPRVREVVIPDSIDPLMVQVRDISPSVCFHLATHFRAVHTPDDVTEMVAANVTFGAELVEAVARTNRCPFVNVGTAWQHYEGRNASPTSLYAATKQAFADILTFYSEVDGLAVGTLELFDTYGPDDPRPKLVSMLFRCARTGETLDLSPGDQLIDLLHVEDAVRALRTVGAGLLDGEHLGARFGARSGSPVTLKELVALVEDVAGGRIDVRWGARPYRAREMFTPWPSPPPPPGWAPEIALVDGLGQIAAATLTPGATSPP